MDKNVMWRKHKGAWWVQAPKGSQNSTVTVIKRDGDRQQVKLGSETDDNSSVPGGYLLYLPAPKKVGREKQRQQARKANGRCKASGCHNPSDQDAPHHQAMGGYCGWCAFDEYDM